MTDDRNALFDFAPFDLLPRDAIGDGVERIECAAEQILFSEGDTLNGLYFIQTGSFDIESSHADLVTRRGPGDVMGERGLLRDGKAVLTARATADAVLLLIPAARFRDLVKQYSAFAEWFAPPASHAATQKSDAYGSGLLAVRVADIMAREPVTCGAAESVADVARIMRDRVISSVLVMDGARLTGIVTVHDLTNKVLAEGLSGETRVGTVMTSDPVVIAPDALGLDALILMAGRGINHLPVVTRGKIQGVIARTDLIRQQATTASNMAAEIVAAPDAHAMSGITARIPALLTSLVSAGTGHAAITRRISDIADAVTRRLLALAEARLGPPPVPYLWLACGSQGRQEQSGVSDQDNCLILDDAAAAGDDPYFAALAQFVSDGLAACGYAYCPGEMMATNPRWRQPRRVWRDYFAGWIREPDPMAQMLASVMFDLRPIGGTTSLYDDLQQEVLENARSNSIFVMHMVSNSLKHTPPLNLFRGFAVIRSGEHKNTVDLKHSGVVPVTDLARVYALKGALDPVNTRNRLTSAQAAGIISDSGGRDLLAAYDLIATARLRHQADRSRAGHDPDNFLAPGELSELDRNHLRDAFMVVKTMQSALGRGH